MLFGAASTPTLFWMGPPIGKRRGELLIGQERSRSHFQHREVKMFLFSFYFSLELWKRDGATPHKPLTNFDREGNLKVIGLFFWLLSSLSECQWYETTRATNNLGTSLIFLVWDVITH